MEDKKHVDHFYRKPQKYNEGGFSNLGEDIINSLGSEKKTLWSSPYVRCKSLREVKEDDKRLEEIYKNTHKEMHIAGKVYLEEIITLALIYNYIAGKVGTSEISEQTIMKYIAILNSNLEEMGVPNLTNSRYCKDLMYQTVDYFLYNSFRLKDEILKERNIKELFNSYLSRISQETIIAATKPNALEVLGIQSKEEEDDVVRKKQLRFSSYFKYTSLKDCR